MADGWITHLATNGAGVIHDWEWAHHGQSTESVRANVATGTFGTWEETGRCLHLAVLTGALREEGFGQSVGRMVTENGFTLPARSELETQLREEPSHALAPARAELLQIMTQHNLADGRHEIAHPWGATSVLGNAFRHDVPLTVHPGIGYDIISNHPLFNGAALGRAAGLDFATFGGSVEGLDNGVVLSVGSAIMGPQVFEKASPASTTSVYKPAEKLSAAMQFTWWIFRMAAAGTGLRANRPRITQPIICAFAKATTVWAAPCTTPSATISISRITC